MDDRSSDAHLLTGIIFLLRKEYEKAIIAAKQAIILNPNNADAYDFMGYSLYVSDRPEDGIEFLKKAIRLNPIPPAMYLYHLGHAYRAAKQYNKAIEAYLMCIKQNPDNYFAHIGLATTYGLLGNQKEAYVAGSNILKLYPEFSIEEFLKDSWLKNQDEINNYKIGLQKAGLK
jgi:adenylate cyclase